MCRQCGNLLSECSDPAIDWHPRKSVCWASASQALGWRHLRDKYAKPMTADALHPLDGARVWVAQTPPPEEQDEFKFR